MPAIRPTVPEASASPFEGTTSRLTTVATHCPYCALQCGVLLQQEHDEITLTGNEDFPVNRGALCIKGWTAAAPLHHPDRLRQPLARDDRGSLVPIDWAEALDRVATGIERVRGQHGAAAVGILGSGALTNEKAYLLGKFARVAVGTPHIDYNGRFCMSSAAAASLRAFGIDRGLPFPLEDLARAEVVLLAGSNPAETMPPLVRYFEDQRAHGGQLIVTDPRESASALAATLHLRLAPGTDAALANGLLHVLIQEDLVDHEYVATRTEGFARVKAAVASYWPERVERITGVPEVLIVQAARRLGAARSAIVLTGRGPEQQTQGVENVLAYINVALALGLPGRPDSGYGCLTGQGNGQGGREHGQKNDQLPGYRRLDDPAARRHVAAIWGVDEQTIPRPGFSASEMLRTLGRPDGVRALFVMGFNALVSAPDAGRVEEGLRALDFLVVCDFFLSETARLADIVLPAAQWAEEDGTMTTVEGRVVRRRSVRRPPGEVHTDLEILSDLAARLGQAERFSYDGPQAVFRELGRASAGGAADYAGITYEKIDRQDGVFWPCPTPDHPGTPRLFTDRFPTASGRARFHPVGHRGPAEEIDREYGLYLTTGRVLAHYQTGTLTRRVDKLQEMAPDPVAEIHPDVASRHRIAEGDLVTLASRRGRATFRAHLTRGIRADTIFAPFHWPDGQSANRLTNAACDPISRMPEFKVCAVRLEKTETSR